MLKCIPKQSLAHDFQIHSRYTEMARKASLYEWKAQGEYEYWREWASAVTEKGLDERTGEFAVRNGLKYVKEKALWLAIHCNNKIKYYPYSLWYFVQGTFTILSVDEMDLANSGKSLKLLN